MCASGVQMFRVVMDDSDMFGVTHSVAVYRHVHAFHTLSTGVAHAAKPANNHVLLFH